MFDLSYMVKLSTDQSIFLVPFGLFFIRKLFSKSQDQDSEKEPKMQLVTNNIINGLFYGTTTLVVASIFVPQRARFIFPLTIGLMGSYHLMSGGDFNRLTIRK